MLEQGQGPSSRSALPVRSPPMTLSWVGSHAGSRQLLIITRQCMDLIKSIYFTDVETKAHIPSEWMIEPTPSPPSFLSLSLCWGRKSLWCQTLFETLYLSCLIFQTTPVSGYYYRPSYRCENIVSKRSDGCPLRSQFVNCRAVIQMCVFSPPKSILSTSPGQVCGACTLLPSSPPPYHLQPF